MEDTLVATGAKNKEEFARFLAGCGCRGTVLASSGSEARRLLGEREFRLVIIAAPLPDEFGRELALYAAETTASGVLLVVAAPQAAEVAAGVEEYGVAVTASPMNRQAVAQAVRLLRAGSRRVARLREENRGLRQRLEDMRLVSRAKCALIQYGGYTEEEAHHTIERRAMDRRISRRQAALEILEGYEGTDSGQGPGRE